MIQKLKMLILSLGSLFILSAPMALAGVASAAPSVDTNVNNNLCSGANLDLSQASDCSTLNAPGDTLSDKIRTVINVFSAIVAAVAVIMIIVAGFRYITSGGKEEGVKAAKTTIMYALIGLVIVALAQVIVQFVLKKTTQ